MIKKVITAWTVLIELMIIKEASDNNDDDDDDDDRNVHINDHSDDIENYHSSTREKLCSFRPVKMAFSLVSEIIVFASHI